MAVRCGWAKVLAVAALLMGAETFLLAQKPRTQSIEDGASGSVTGKLTDLHSNPLAGVTIVLRNPATGAEARTTTTNKGAYIFLDLEPGEYTLAAESPGLGRGQVESIVVIAGESAHVDTALDLKTVPFEAILAKLRGGNRLDLEQMALPLLEVKIAVEPIKIMPLPGRRADGEIPVNLPKLKSTLATEPLKTLPVADRGGERAGEQASVGSTPAIAVGISSQVSEARPGAPVIFQEVVHSN